MYTNRLTHKLIQVSKSLSSCNCHQRLLRLDTTYSSNSSVSLDPSPSQMKWDLVSAVCLERMPVITPLPTPIEKKMIDMLEKLERLNSLKSDHELWQEKDKNLAKNKKKSEDTDPDLASRQTSQDYEDACNEELAKFTFSPRTTVADTANDLKSTNRKLDKHLVFVVQKEMEGKTIWTLPQSSWENGETLRQTAERALKTHIDSSNVKFLGNAPWGVHTIKYPASQRAKLGTLGTKIFFYKAQLLNKNGGIPSSTCEYNWLGREELSSCLEPGFHHSVSQFIIDED